MAILTPCPDIDGVVLVEPVVHTDDRGAFLETYRRDWFPDGKEMVQGNRALRGAGAVVGLHYHLLQADYWYVTSGHARVVLHDLREGSPTQGATLQLDAGEVDGTENNHLGIYIPPGVAHGFAALTDLSLDYLVDRYYDPTDEHGVAWDDPEIAAEWIVHAPVLSLRDRANPRLADLPDALRPRAGAPRPTGPA